MRAVADLAAGLYELCKVCQGDCEGCVWCDGLGLVAHECSDDE